MPKRRTAAVPLPAGWHNVTPRLIVRNARGLVAFLQSVFEAQGEFDDVRPSILRIGDSVVMVSEAGARPVATAFLYVYVNDVRATHRRGVDAGARAIEEPFDTGYGDVRGMIEDRWGNTWQIAMVQGGRHER